MVVHNNTASGQVAKLHHYANYIQQELYTPSAVVGAGQLSQTIQPAELVELQSDLCEQNEYQRREMHRINQIILKL